MPVINLADVPYETFRDGVTYQTLVGDDRAKSLLVQPLHGRSPRARSASRRTPPFDTARSSPARAQRPRSRDHLALAATAVVVAYLSIAAHHAMTRYFRVVIVFHQIPHCTGSVWAARFRRHLFVGHHFAYGDLRHNGIDTLRKACLSRCYFFHVLLVARVRSMAGDGRRPETIATIQKATMIPLEGRTARPP
jgi:hypothetical protein